MTSSVSAAPTSPSRPRRSGLALTVIALAQLMVVLDATIVNVALPSVQRSLGFSTAELSWVVNAYTLSFGGLLLLAGRAGDILGRRRVFVTGLVVFGIGSLIGGLASSSEWLLVARSLQGVGAAIVAPAALSLIATSFQGEREINRAFGVFAAVSGAGGAIGLLLGGVLTEWLSWRWVMFVNVPLAIGLALLAPLCIAETERQRGRFDILGAITSTVGMVALVYGFTRVASGGWGDSVAVTSFVVAVVMLILFVIIERIIEQPITPLRMFADRNRAAIYVIALALTGALMGLFFFLTMFMQNVLNYGPLQAGLAFLPVSISIVVVVGMTSKLLPKIGQKTPLVAGLALNTVALGWLSTISADSTYLQAILGPLLLFGIGTGLLFVPLTMIGVSGVEQHEAGAASGVLNAMQQVGGSLGLSILVTAYGFAVRDVSGDPIAVLTEGTPTAFLVAAIFAAVAFLIAVLVVRPAVPPAAGAPAAPAEVHEAEAAQPV